MSTTYNKFLSNFGNSTNLVIWSGGLKVKKSFDVEVFDEDYGFIKIKVPEGYYTYRVLDIRGWKPTQIGFVLKMNIDNRYYEESGWLDIAGFFSSEYVETEKVWSVEVIENGVKEIKVQDVSETEATQCFYNIITHMKSQEGVYKVVHLVCAGEDADDFVCKHADDEYNIINASTGTYMNKGHKPIDLSDLKLEFIEFEEHEVYPGYPDEEELLFDEDFEIESEVEDLLFEDEELYKFDE